MLSQNREMELVAQLNSITEPQLQTCAFRRFRRKLIMRHVKRKTGIPLFDLDASVNKQLAKLNKYDQGPYSDSMLRASRLFPDTYPPHLDSGILIVRPSGKINESSIESERKKRKILHEHEQSQQQAAALAQSKLKLQSKTKGNVEGLDHVLDRYWVPGLASGPNAWWSGIDLQSSAGIGMYDVVSGAIVEKKRCASFESPLTGKVLKPVIWHDPATGGSGSEPGASRVGIPPKLQILRDIEAIGVGVKQQEEEEGHVAQAQIHGIDYVFLRPWHLRDVNALLCREFWPGIDVSESLEYPEYTCVVLYKKLVIGFGMVTPGYSTTYVSYIAVHPDWQRGGIGTIILFHLLNSGPKRDITLHVRADNPAMLLYQRYGFKPEQYLVGYYRKYFPPGSPVCPHAFFLRMKR